MKTISLCAFLLITLFVMVACNKPADRDVTPTPPVVTPPITQTTVSATPAFYVSITTGDDSRTATQAQNAATPWKTIQKALNSLPISATLIIAGGTYAEKVKVPTSANGTATAPTLIRNKVGETVILDGQNTGSQWEGLFSLNGNQHIIVKGLKVQNGFWYGFSGEATTNVTLDSCSTFNTRASGIYVKTSSQLTITRNNVRRACQEPNRDASGNGTQECITLGGCNQFSITKNEIWDSIVPGNAGGEGIDVKGGCYDGEISGNYVHDIVPLGIYVDAGSREQYNIRVFGNRVFNTGGLSVAGELGGHARDIYFYNNVVKDSKSSGLTFQSIGNGKYTNVYVVNNTFYNNAISGFAGDIGNYSTNTGNTNIVIRNNIFYNKTANYRFSIWHNIAAPHIISHNLYFDFKQSQNNANSFLAANLTANDLRIDPEFVNIAGNDFSLKTASPAINKGIAVTLPASTSLLFTTDFNGKSRGTSGWDMGAFEF